MWLCVVKSEKYKKVKHMLHYIKLMIHLPVWVEFLKNWLTYKRQVINSRHQIPQGQSIAKLETVLQNILLENINWIRRMSRENMETDTKPVTRSLGVFFIYVWINGCVNSRKAGDLGCHRAYYDVNVTRITLTNGKIVWCVVKCSSISSYHILSSIR